MDDDKKKKKKKLHIVMFPWLAFGHIIPYLQLSKLLAEKGHRISFLSAPRNIDRLPKLPSNLSPFIDFVKLPLPKIHNLPENAEATIEVPFDKVKYLKMAYDGLQLPLFQFLEKSKPDWIFHDFAPYWLPPIAARLKIFTSFFSIFPASLMAVAGPIGVLKGSEEETRTKPEDFVGKPKWLPFETTIGFQYFEVIRMLESFTGDDDSGVVSDLFRFGTTIEGCDVVTFRTSSELESEWLKILNTELYQKPVIPVGMLLPTMDDDDSDGVVDPLWKEIKMWLDNQATNSVVYIAFGTEMKPEQAELDVIALGLEQSGLPFFWVLRTKRGESDPEIRRLPEGFEERTKNRGFMCRSWAPQLKILSHESVGGLLIHSGWSSVVEAIQFEKGIVMLTFLADQGVIGRFLNEKKIAHLIPRDSRDGSFTSKSVADALRLVMVEEEGKIYREKIKEMKELLCDQVKQDNYVDNLLDFLQNYQVKDC